MSRDSLYSLDKVVTDVSLIRIENSFLFKKNIISTKEQLKAHRQTTDQTFPYFHIPGLDII